VMRICAFVPSIFSVIIHSRESLGSFGNGRKSGIIVCVFISVIFSSHIRLGFGLVMVTCRAVAVNPLALFHVHVDRDFHCGNVVAVLDVDCSDFGGGTVAALEAVAEGEDLVGGLWWSGAVGDFDRGVEAEGIPRRNVKANVAMPTVVTPPA
jgi:hypothetical protein